MKKATKILMIIATLIITVSLFVACNPGSQTQDFTVTFVTNGGSSVASQTLSVIDVEPVTTRENYDFAGWYDNEELNGNRVTFPYTLIKDTALYAKWIERRPAEYEVTFVTNGGSAVQSVTASEIPTEPITTRDNCDFLGWYDNGEFSGNRIAFPYTVTGPATLYAKWQEMIERVWVQTALSDYETEQSSDGSVKIVSYLGSEESIILPVDDNIVFERSFLWQEENPTVKAVSLPINVVEADAYWFAYAQIEEIAVADEHPTLSAQNGVLFSKDGTELIAYPNSKPVITYAVPSTVKTVGYAAFNSNAVIKHLIVSEGVEKLDVVCFAGMENLETISLPSTLVETGNSCLIANPKLREAVFPSTLTTCASTTFNSECVSLKRIVAPACMNTSGLPNLEYREFNGGTEIAAGYCMDCPSLDTAVISGEIRSLGASSKFRKGVFQNCENLRNVTLNDGLELIGSRTFNGCKALSAIEIPSTVTEISPNAFNGCAALQNINLPQGLLTIGDSAFANSGIEELHIPSTVTKLASLEGATYLKTVECDAGLITKLYPNFLLSSKETLQNLIISSGSSLPDTGRGFNGFGSLHTLVIPASVNSIDEKAFAECAALVQITNLSGVDWTPYVYNNAGERVPSSAEVRRSLNEQFEGFITSEANGFVKYTFGSEVRLLDFDRKMEVESLSASDFSGYTSIGAYVFRNCAALRSVAIPSNIKTVGDRAFYGCAALQTLTIADGVQSIGQNAFMATELLATVTIPQSVTSIGMQAFANNGAGTLAISVKGYPSRPDGWHQSWFVDSSITVEWNA